MMQHGFYFKRRLLFEPRSYGGLRNGGKDGRVEHDRVSAKLGSRAHTFYAPIIVVITDKATRTRQ